MDKYNCTTPWMLHHSRKLVDPNASICGKDKRKAASNFYVERRYASYDECEDPCVEMKIYLDQQFKEERYNGSSHVMILIGRYPAVSTETRAETFLSVGRVLNKISN